MAIYRQIHTAFWTDSKVSENFTPEDRYFMLFLLTNPYTNMVGCYELSGKNMGFLMGYSHETVVNLINRFTKVHKLVHYDEQTKEVLILNWSKYNWIKNPKLIPKMVTDIKSIKSKEFRDEVILLLNRFFGFEINIDTVSIPYTYPIDIITHEEKEKEKDKEKDKDNIKKKGQGVPTSSPKESFTKPSLSEIIEYKSELKSTVDAEYFLDYHIANGWKVSKGQPMKDWKATFRNWTRNQKDISKKDSQNQASHADTPESIKRAEEIGIIMI